MKEKRIIRSISINEKTWKLAQKIAKKENRSVSNLIERLIEEKSR